VVERKTRQLHSDDPFPVLLWATWLTPAWRSNENTPRRDEWKIDGQKLSTDCVSEAPCRRRLTAGAMNGGGKGSRALRQRPPSLLGDIPSGNGTPYRLPAVQIPSFAESKFVLI